MSAALALCILTTDSGPAVAQTVTATTGAVNGVVTDGTKAVVPGVTVSLAGPSLIAAQTTVTDQSGAYRFSAIPPGDYTLTFVLTGFATIVRDGVRVALGFTVSIDAELTPGAVTDSVTVTGAPVIDLASTEITTHFDSEKLASLLGARDIVSVLPARGYAGRLGTLWGHSWRRPRHPRNTWETTFTATSA